MSSRPAAHVVKRYPAPAGEEPNKHIPEITVDFRVFWTPKSSRAQIGLAIHKALIELHNQLDQKRGEYVGPED